MHDIQLDEPVHRHSLRDDIDHILVSEEELQVSIGNIARQLEEDYAGKELVLVGVLKGAVMFIVDLARSTQLPVTLDFMAVASY